VFRLRETLSSPLLSVATQRSIPNVSRISEPAVGNVELIYSIPGRYDRPTRADGEDIGCATLRCVGCRLRDVDRIARWELSARLHNGEVPNLQARYRCVQQIELCGRASRLQGISERCQRIGLVAECCDRDESRRSESGGV